MHGEFEPKTGRHAALNVEELSGAEMTEME